MFSLILTLDQSGKDNTPRKRAEYSLDPKSALICYIEQDVNGNFNTCEYPDFIEGMRESPTIKDHWYFDDFKNNQVIAAYPM